MKTDRIFGQPSTFRIIGKCLTVTDFGGVVQKARKNTASPAIVGGIGQADCLDGAELSALSSGWDKRPSGISGDQLTKVKKKAPPRISDGQHFRPNAPLWPFARIRLFGAPDALRTAAPTRRTGRANRIADPRPRPDCSSVNLAC